MQLRHMVELVRCNGAAPGVMGTRKQSWYLHSQHGATVVEVCYYTAVNLCDKSHMVRADAQVNGLPGRWFSLAQAILRTTRRAAPHLLTVLLVWNIALHAPLCCIVHCHIAPWLMMRTSSHQKSLFTCTFKDSTDRSLPAVSTLPPVIHAAILTLPLLLSVLITAVGWLTLASYTFSHDLAPPPTPPPRNA